MGSNCQAACGRCSSGGSPTPASNPAPTAAPTAAPAPSSGGPSSATLRAVLDRHNMYRCMHGVNALTWDPAIAANAQQYATSTGGTMRHSSYTSRQGVGGFNVGENLASGVTDAGAVDMWYNEIQHTSGGLVSEFGINTGHYTQVVWRDTSRLGCGIQGTLLVCQYGEGGNMAGGFESNVLAPSRTRRECRGSR